MLAVLGGVRIEHLLVVAAASALLTVVLDVACRSFVPELVGRVNATLHVRGRGVVASGALLVAAAGLVPGRLWLALAPTRARATHAEA